MLNRHGLITGASGTGKTTHAILMANYLGRAGYKVLVIDMEKTAGKNAMGKKAERELEAKVIASKIQELIRNHKVVDKKTGENRSVEYSDIVILTRSITGFAEKFTVSIDRL